MAPDQGIPSLGAAMTNDLRKALEPCPFCGGQPIKRGEYIECGDCSAQGPTDREPITGWNTRAALAAQPAPDGREAEDIYALVKSTLIGFRSELNDRDINFICDQISRKVVAYARHGATLSPQDAGAGWQPISELPETDPKFLGKGVLVLLFSPQFGIRTGEAFNAHGRKWANVGNLHGNAIDDWGASHWMPLPAEPTLPRAEREVGK